MNAQTLTRRQFHNRISSISIFVHDCLVQSRLGPLLVTLPDNAVLNSAAWLRVPQPQASPG